MTSQKCQLRLGQKIHGPVTMDRFKTTCPKWLGGFFYACPKWVFLTKISSKKNRYTSSDSCHVCGDTRHKIIDCLKYNDMENMF
jgi:hypothetical protein